MGMMYHEISGFTAHEYLQSVEAEAQDGSHGAGCRHRHHFDRRYGRAWKRAQTEHAGQLFQLHIHDTDPDLFRGILVVKQQPG